MSHWFRFAARGRVGSSCFAIGARHRLLVYDLELSLKAVPDRDASIREKPKDAEGENEQEISTHRLEVTHETIGGEPRNRHNLVSETE